jgi:hypothetical protein
MDLVKIAEILSNKQHLLPNNNNLGKVSKKTKQFFGGKDKFSEELLWT